MRTRSERSFVLFFAFFVFFCLLLSGGSRLIGYEGEDDTIAVRPTAAVRAVLSGAPAPVQQTGRAPVREQIAQRQDIMPAPQDQYLHTRVLSDANGNVLGDMTYLRAVYQAFTLGDGFV